MALTPDDVVTKQFQHVRFKEGFDPDEVDDFLDEIVVEWRKATAEADELRTQNEQLKARVAELESGEGTTSTWQDQPSPAVEAPAPAPAAPAAEPGATPGAASAGIIELAQRLHDEHVAEGRAQRDQLIAEAQNQAAAIVAEAEGRGREEIARQERERAGLETRIAELRQFERDYRTQLRSYIEGKLRDLDTTATPSGSNPVSAIDA